MAGFEEVAEAGVKGGSKAAGFWYLPGGKINIIVTLFVFAFLVVEGSIASVATHSFYPLVDATLFRVVAADAKISQEVDGLAVSKTPKPDAWYAYPFTAWFWEKIVFWLNILCSLWFLYFFGLLIYWLVSSLNNTSLFITLILTAIIFLGISGYANLLVYEAGLAGVSRDADPLKVMVDDVAHSVPLSGVTKLVRYFVDSNYASIVASNAFVRDFSNIPTGINVSGGVVV